MAPFILALLVAWLCSLGGSRRRYTDDPPQKSKRWARKALKHGLRYYVEKDEAYIRNYNRKYKKT